MDVASSSDGTKVSITRTTFTSHIWPEQCSSPLQVAAAKRLMTGA